MRGAVPLLVVLLWGCGGGPAEAPAPAAPTDAASGTAAVVADDRAGEPTTMDGIYTPAQADRGRAVFENVCSECHSTTDWTEDGFRERWNGESVWTFWHYVWERMPDGEPPYSLPRDQVSDVTAYILELNEVPAGGAELGSHDDALDVHWLVFPGMGMPPGR